MADRPARFTIDQMHRTPAGGISRAATVVMHLRTLLWIARVSCVQTAIRAADDVDEVHREILSSTR